MSRVLLERALDALSGSPDALDSSDAHKLMADIESELAKPLPKPVAWMKKHENGVVIFSLNPAEESDFTPLYAEPPARKPLTDDEIDEFCSEMPEQVKDVFKMGVRFAEDRIHGIRDYLNGQITHGITDPEQSKPQSNAI
jgi:hypothetical protein